MNSPSSVAVVGGTGFLGSVIVEHLERSGVNVLVVSRNARPARDSSACARRRVTADLLSTGVDGWASLLDGVGTVVVAAGADERHPIVGDPMTHFRETNVDAVDRLCTGAVQAGVDKVVVLGSIFSAYAHGGHFSGASTNPYLRSRLLQEELLSDLGNGPLSTAVVRVSYAFGPGGDGLWAGLIRYCSLPGPLPAIRGSMLACDATSVAEAVVDEISDRSPGFHCISAVDATLPNVDLLQEIRSELGRQGRLVLLPDRVFAGLMWLSDASSQLARRPIAMSHRELGSFMLTDHPSPAVGPEAEAGRTKTVQAIRAMVREHSPWAGQRRSLTRQ